MKTAPVSKVHLVFGQTTPAGLKLTDVLTISPREYSRTLGQITAEGKVFMTRLRKSDVAISAREAQKIWQDRQDFAREILLPTASERKATLVFVPENRPPLIRLCDSSSAALDEIENQTIWGNIKHTLGISPSDFFIFKGAVRLTDETISPEQALALIAQRQTPARNIGPALREIYEAWSLDIGEHRWWQEGGLSGLVTVLLASVFAAPQTFEDKIGEQVNQANIILFLKKYFSCCWSISPEKALGQSLPALATPLVRSLKSIVEMVEEKGPQEILRLLIEQKISLTQPQQDFFQEQTRGTTEPGNALIVAGLLAEIWDRTAYLRSPDSFVSPSG